MHSELEHHPELIELFSKLSKSCLRSIQADLSRTVGEADQDEHYLQDCIDEAIARRRAGVDSEPADATTEDHNDVR